MVEYLDAPRHTFGVSKIAKWRKWREPGFHPFAFHFANFRSGSLTVTSMTLDAISAGPIFLP